MNISLNLNEEDALLFTNYAELNGVTLPQLLRNAVIEKIEDEYDLSVYKKAMDKFNDNPITFTLDEIEKDLGLLWHMI